jgi:hypothetical protein
MMNLPSVTKDNLRTFDGFQKCSKYVLEFFDLDENGKYTFIKYCTSSNFPLFGFKRRCAKNIVERFNKLKEGTIERQKQCTMIHNSTHIDKNLTYESVKDAVEYCKKKSVVIPTETLEWLQTFFPGYIPTVNINTSGPSGKYGNEFMDALEHLDPVEDVNEAISNTPAGGRRSRYRRRPTKKYFKSRRHSLSKKKRHMKTKRHMKRHRKTKRH